MQKYKIMTIIGTRPEIIRLSAVIKELDKHTDHILVHTGQNYDYELNEIFFEDLNLRKPDYFLKSAGNHLGETIGNVISKSYEVLIKEKPDAILVLGDTNSCLAAISAKRLKIPIFHMEAGNRCFDQNVPEEINRKIVDHISDINLTYTEHSRRYLLLEGKKPEYTYVTGSPIPEVIKQNLDKINNSNILSKLNLKKDDYFLLSCHREENIDIEKNFYSIFNTINYLAKEYNKIIIFSTHPRTLKKINENSLKLHDNVKIMKPFGFSDYVNLQMNSLCVISDSGTLSEESSFLNFKAVLLRTSTERPEAIDTGNLVVGNIKEKSLLNAIDLVLKQNIKNREFSIPKDYLEENVSKKVVRIIFGYIDIINNRVWGK